MMFDLNSVIGWLELLAAAFIVGFGWTLGAWVVGRLTSPRAS